MNRRMQTIDFWFALNKKNFFLFYSRHTWSMFSASISLPCHRIRIINSYPILYPVSKRLKAKIGIFFKPTNRLNVEPTCKKVMKSEIQMGHFCRKYSKVRVKVKSFLLALFKFHSSLTSTCLLLLCNRNGS